MKQFDITSLEAGQRLDKYLVKCLPEAGKSFLYKMMRKKNIVLNDKKADGSEKLQNGDQVKLYFSDETFEKFAGTAAKRVENRPVLHDLAKVAVLYEDEDIILVNKPSGMLSQKAEKNDISLVEYVTAHLLSNGSVTESELRTFHPGICNRLDRNTSGIVVAGKTVKGLQEMTLAFKERTLHKYYICIVRGRINEKQRISGYLKKDEKNNKVQIYSEAKEDLLPIETEYIPVCSNEFLTLLKVNLITGRSHQIRAHLASIGHPLAGDMKYGNRQWNEQLQKKYQIHDQMLHAFELDMPERQLHVYTDIPNEFIRVMKEEELWEPGIQGVLEALH